MHHHRNHHRHHCPPGTRYPPGTPLRDQPHTLLMLTLVTIGAFGLVWAGMAIHDRWGKTGTWIYVGALCIASALGHSTTPAPAPTSVPPAPLTVVTVVTAPAPLHPNP